MAKFVIKTEKTSTGKFRAIGYVNCPVSRFAPGGRELVEIVEASTKAGALKFLRGQFPQFASATVTTV